MKWPLVYDSTGNGCFELPVRRTSEQLRFDNGPKFGSKGICYWLKKVDVRKLFIAKGSSWESEYIESFKMTLREERLNLEMLLSLEKAC